MFLLKDGSKAEPEEVDFLSRAHRYHGFQKPKNCGEGQTSQRGVLVSAPGSFWVSRFLIWSAPKPTRNTASNAGRTSSFRSCSLAPAIKPNKAITSVMASRK